MFLSIVLLENLTGKKIKILRLDNGGEYTSNEFKDFCLDEGIERELTTSYTPQKNGIAQRKNRSIVEATMAMIPDQNLLMYLWAEASKTAVFVGPRKILGNKTPEEAFTGKKPDIRKLKIFGCLVYFHVLHDKRSKLDTSGRKGATRGACGLKVEEINDSTVKFGTQLLAGKLLRNQRPNEVSAGCICATAKCAMEVTMSWAHFLVEELRVDCLEAQENKGSFHYSWLLILIALIGWREPVDSAFIDPIPGRYEAARYGSLWHSSNVCFVVYHMDIDMSL